MNKPTNKQTGDFGEQEVCELIKCPSCGNKLVLLPAGFPLYDIQCSRCMFRAQVKTNNSAPKGTIRGAGWEIYNKVLKAGYLAPSLIANFKWTSKEGSSQAIRFYPFIPKSCIKKYQLSEKARRKNYKMFRYENLEDIPFFTLLEKFKPSDEFMKKARTK